MTENGLVFLSDSLSNDIWTHETLQPILGNWLIGEIVILDIEFFLIQKFADLLIIIVCEGVGALNYFLDLGIKKRHYLFDFSFEFFPEFPFYPVSLFLHLLVEFAFFDKVAVQCNCLNFFFKSW